ncbi:enoyl-[acyl-carrier protein] reductase II [Filibacter limicola]|uniref:Probable nitronate monooxygenase n=2 Tax=Sporosarcina limicola TaxID=34101 RepID=A0A927RF94_9BACL|nr:enoyl-[acyl-carrier protein] reductase II [Sporosarcina limicola]
MMNQVCKLLTINYPIIQGGMGNISSAELAIAVSEAGGLGTIGCGTSSVEEVESKIRHIKKRTDLNFSVNIAINVTPHTEELIELVIKHQVPVVSLSAGNPAPYIPLLHDNGITVITLVASVKHAQKAEKAGADILVAEGFEAAGINSNLELTTFTLIPQITASVKVPVIAAGGIGDGKGLAAAFMLGASGVQMGTRFIATKEMPVHDTYKQRLLNATDTETMIIGRQIGRVRRVLKNDYAEELFKREWEGLTLEQYNELTSETLHVKGAIDGDMKNGFINSGQVSGLISDIPAVKDLIEEMMREARGYMINSLKELDSLCDEKD